MSEYALNDALIELESMKARAETAEAQVVELQSLLAECDRRGLAPAKTYRERAEKAEARVTELEAALHGVVGLHPHSGACCTFDDAKKVVVTIASCRCNAPERTARVALREWPGDSVSEPQPAYEHCKGCMAEGEERNDCKDYGCVMLAEGRDGPKGLFRATPARLDPDGTAKPLTEIVAAMPESATGEGGRTMHVGQATHYVARPVEPRSNEPRPGGGARATFPASLAPTNAYGFGQSEHAHASSEAWSIWLKDPRTKDAKWFTSTSKGSIWSGSFAEAEEIIAGRRAAGSPYEYEIMHAPDKVPAVPCSRTYDSGKYYRERCGKGHGHGGKCGPRSNEAVTEDGLMLSTGVYLTAAEVAEVRTAAPRLDKATVDPRVAAVISAAIALREMTWEPNRTRQEALGRLYRALDALPAIEARTDYPTTKEKP